jgi:hypothetical protein
MAAAPAVSVVMPVYNGESFLRDAVDSVLTQTLAEFELIVIDDGSTDSTPEILAGYAAQDQRVLVHRQPNSGRAIALNRGFAVARAPFVARLDADDLAVTHRLEHQRQFLLEHPEVAVVGGAITFVDRAARSFAEVRYPLADVEIRKALEHTTPLAHPAVMLRRDAFDRVGGYRVQFKVAEDIDLWLRLAVENSFANLPEPVTRYRIHPGQDTARAVQQMVLETVAARVAARARAGGLPDPLDTVEAIDRRTVIAAGATDVEITSMAVEHMTWLGKTISRAGYPQAASDLLAEASSLARSSSGSRSLVAVVLRARAHHHREQGYPLRARLGMLRAALAARSRP